MNYFGSARVSRALVIAVLALTSTACATITRGSNEKWTVETDPAGASVHTSNGYSCSPTPCTIKMPRKAKFDATITKDGYQTATAYVRNEMNGAGATGMLGNAVIGGVLGAAIDLSTGATQDLYPNPLVVRLMPTAPPTSRADAAPAGATNH